MANTEQFTQALNFERLEQGRWRASMTLVKRDTDGDEQKSLEVAITMVFPSSGAPSGTTTEEALLRAAKAALEAHLAIRHPEG